MAPVVTVECPVVTVVAVSSEAVILSNEVETSPVQHRIVMMVLVLVVGGSIYRKLFWCCSVICEFICQYKLYLVRPILMIPILMVVWILATFQVVLM